MGSNIMTKEERLRESASQLIDKSRDSMVATTLEVGSRSLMGLKDGSWSATKTLYDGAKNTVSEALDVTNRYTRDIYDVGQNGQADLTGEAASFLAGNAAMLTRTGVHLANIPIKCAEKGVANALYNDKRIAKYQVKGQDILKNNPGADRHYYEILAGKDKIEILTYKDRLAWNRYQDNGLNGLGDKGKAAAAKYNAGRADRMMARKAVIIAHANKKHTFHPMISTKRMLGNQSRKLVTKTAQGNNPDDIANKTVLRFYNMANNRVVKKATKNLVFHPIKSTKAIISAPLAPIRWTKAIVSMIGSLVSGMMSFICSLPVIVSIIAVLLPLIVAIITVITVISAVLNFNAYKVPASSIMSTSYAANAFIYEAKQRGWKDDAIVGVLAYILQEGGGMGTFTYESYDYINGPSFKTRDTTMDNEAWIDWLGKVSTKNHYYDLYYKGNTSRWASIGLGLLQDSDVWPSASTPNYKEAENASKMIEFAQEKGKPWQDPETQMQWIFERKFQPENNPFDDNQDTIEESIDPTKHEFSAEEWCRRVTAGVGMPGWTMHNNSSYMLEHVNKIGAAQTYLDNYTGFSYWAPVVGDLLNGPNFANEDAWTILNPYGGSGLIGQCTWFAWGRFYEIYGFGPTATWNGKDWVNGIIQTYPDKFEASDTPKPGAVFSTSGPSQYGHVGIVVDVRGDMLVIEEGNYSPYGTPDGTFETAQKLVHSGMMTIDQLRAQNGHVTFAVPKDGL